MKSVIFAGMLLWHKWHVLIEGIRIGGVPLWRLVVHDVSKFRPSEWNGYVKGFLCERHIAESMPDVCEAWYMHRKRNEHHWEYWVDGDVVYPMPYTYVREMVIDWHAAQKTYDKGDSIVPYLKNHVHVMRLHDDTHNHLREVLLEVGISWDEIVSSK